jgi:hypothetical protein
MERLAVQCGVPIPSSHIVRIKIVANFRSFPSAKSWTTVMASEYEYEYQSVGKSSNSPPYAIYGIVRKPPDPYKEVTMALLGSPMTFRRPSTTIPLSIFLICQRHRFDTVMLQISLNHHRKIHIAPQENHHRTL